MTGSIWRKWDLHFHTQSSYDYKNKSITNQEIIDELTNKNISVVAITDHHIIDTRRIKDLQKLAANKVTILPAIEFRSELGGSDSIHFIGIFSENCDIEDIWIKIQSGCRITKADIANAGGDQNIHCDLKETCKLIHDLGGIVSIHAGGKSNTIENITNSLPYKMAMKTEIVLNNIDILELGKQDDQENYINIVFPAIKKRIPMIICSDNHNIKNYEIKQHLWIKAEPTFEGLRQILYEPEFRIHIGENPPINPPIRLNKVSINFPKESKFENEIFCLSGKYEIEFSPNFTCLIGGRGTGKSTILNLIHEKLKPGENLFFKERKIWDSSNKPISINECVSIDNDADEKYIEFLSQNEIEDFAKDNNKLTAAIYNRLVKRDEYGILAKSEETLKEKLEALKTYIVNKRKLGRLNSEFDQINKEIQTANKIVESFTSSEYNSIIAEIKEKTIGLNDINTSLDEYNVLVEDIIDIIDKKEYKKANNLYSEETNRIIKKLEDIVKETEIVDFSTTTLIKENLTKELEDHKEKLRKYLADKGLTIDNLNDITNSTFKINILEEEKKKKKSEIEGLQKRIESFDLLDINKASKFYKEEIEIQIKAIASILATIDNPNVKPITLSLELDENAAMDKVFFDFKLIFEGLISQSNHRGDSILKEILFAIHPKDISEKEKLIEAIKKYPSVSTAKLFLQELLQSNENFEAYKLICYRTFLNYLNFKKIKVFYDGRPIENSSFGQRCTAILIILLLLGNNPIIIDEPEAHLDSYLIANYLVDVIKKTKQNRQIIFATHNANFVINGDAELIHILNIMDDSNLTTYSSTTIENKTTRGVLIGLEGGEEAFLKRENKYQFKKMK